MWPYPWTHVGTPSHLGHMDRVAATMPSQAHAGAAQEAPDIGQWEGQDVPLVRPSSCKVKGGIPSSRRYLPTYLWNNGAAGDSPDVEWMDVLTDEDPTTQPSRPPWRAPTWALPDPAPDPTIYVLDNEHYNNAPRGSLPPIGNLPDSGDPLTPMNHTNYRTTVVTLTTRLLFAFCWLVGDAERAMGIVRGAHDGECGEFLHRGGAMTPGATERPMAAYL